MGTVLVDGNPVDISGERSLGDLLPGHDPALSVAVIRPGAVSSAETQQFLVKTTAGEMVIETATSGSSVALITLPDLAVRWEDRVSVSLGPFSAGFTPARRPSRYERGDVILGCGGYDPTRSVLVFARRTHSADHGAAADGGRIGQVVSGRGVMDRLGPGDQVLGIEAVLSFSESVDAVITTDLAYPVSEGMQIISFLQIDVQGADSHAGTFSDETAGSVEHLMLALRSGKFVCSQQLSTHIRCDTLAGTPVPYEMGGPRREGAVMMRTSGKKQGSLYIYTTDLPRSLAHTQVGQVTHGIELARLAREGEVFRVVVHPEKFDLVGIPLDQAVSYARSHKVSLSADREGADRMVVTQDPATTLEVLSGGVVMVHTVPDSQVIDITLDDQAAPDTCRIFREITGLKYHPVGKLPLFFAFDDVYLFQTKIPKTTNLKPENTPDDVVSAGLLAITNESRKGVGMVGVRTSDNSEFGPTSEPFSGTNVIGAVLNLHKLEGLREGDQVYFREVRK